MHARDSYLRTRLGIQADSASTTNMATSSDNAEPVVDISSKKITTSRHCCVPLCTSDSRYQPKLNFHHIPKDEALKKQWIHNIRRDEGPMFKISKATVVCSKHFKAEDYGGWNPVRKRLKPGAVPSIFNLTNIKEPRRALKRKLVAPAPKPDTEKENICESDGSSYFENDPNCSHCDFTDWQETGCDAPCGGVNTKIRWLEGINCDNLNQTVYEQCSECECEYMGATYTEGERWQDECSYYVCEEGTPTINGTVTCDMPTCQENERLVDDPEKPCCQICEEVTKQCTVKSMTVKEGPQILKNASGEEEVCIFTQPFEYSFCDGHCGPSQMVPTLSNGFEIVGISSSCECCKGTDTENVPVELDCNGNRRMINIQNVKSCACMACTAWEEYYTPMK